jgi:putative endonuclease
MPGRRGASRRDRRALGRYGEKLAEIHLAHQGFRILARNLHLRHAELDLLALEGRTLCFVEVRLRSSHSFGSAAESVDQRKRLRLARAAAQVLAEHQLPSHDTVRFDLLTIDARTHPPALDLIRDAFQLSR